MSAILVKASAFIQAITNHVGDHYVYGTVGQTYTVALAKSREALYGRIMGDGYYCKLVNGIKDFFKGLCSVFYGKFVADCSGLVRYGRRVCGGGDVSASSNGLFGLCVKTGAIATMPHIPGTLLFIDDGGAKPHKHHVGVYVGAGQVIQAAGARTGIIKGKMHAGWTHWGLASWMQLDLPADGQAIPDPTVPVDHGDGSSGKPADPEFDQNHVPYLSKGDSGPMVQYLQELLAKAGCKLPKSANPDGSMDGIFGRETDKAVRTFQTAHKLASDGIVGPKTWTALLGVECH